MPKPRKTHRALYHVDFDELQIEFDFNDKHRESVAKAKLPVLLNLCQCLAKLGGGGGGRGENAGRAADYASQAIKLDATVRKHALFDCSVQESTRMLS